MLKVYHSIQLARPFGEKPSFPQDYAFVATVDTNNLDEAYELTNNINHLWVLNNKVKSPLSNCRSTSYGDIIIDESEKVWFCDMFGWTEYLPCD